jgi:hypothetical protein
MRKGKVLVLARLALLEVIRVSILETEAPWAVSQDTVVYLMAWGMTQFTEAAFKVILEVATE